MRSSLPATSASGRPASPARTPVATGAPRARRRISATPMRWPVSSSLPAVSTISSASWSSVGAGGMLLLPLRAAPRPPARTPAGYREYDPAILKRLAFIRQCQAAGLTLEQIRQVLGIRDGGQPPCVHVTGLITRRLAEVEARLADLARTRDQLTALAARAAAQDPADCLGYCSIIAG